MGTFLVYKKLNETNELFLQQTFGDLESAEAFVALEDSDVIEYNDGEKSTIVYGANPTYTITPVQAKVISKMQAVIALAVVGKLQAVETAIQAKGGLYWLAWEYADSIELSSQMLLDVWSTLDYSYEELKQIFNFAYNVKP